MDKMTEEQYQICIDVSIYYRRIKKNGSFEMIQNSKSQDFISMNKLPTNDAHFLSDGAFNYILDRL